MAHQNAQLHPSAITITGADFTATGRHLDTANMRGPFFLHNKANNDITRQFLSSILDPILIKNDISKTMRDAQSTRAYDKFQLYVCTALARHYSYFHNFSHEPTVKAELEKFYIKIRAIFSGLCEPGLQLTVEEENWYIQEEINIMHEVWALQPKLFEACVGANEDFLSCLEEDVPIIAKVHPNDDPLSLVDKLIGYLKDCWTDLSDPADILDGRDPLYVRYLADAARQKKLLTKYKSWAHKLMRHPLDPVSTNVTHQHQTRQPPYGRENENPNGTPEDVNWDESDSEFDSDYDIDNESDGGDEPSVVRQTGPRLRLRGGDGERKNLGGMCSSGALGGWKFGIRVFKGAVLPAWFRHQHCT